LDESHARKALGGCRRVVVKIGSQALADDPATFGRVANEIALARDAGLEVVLVSSGAIALGLEPLGMTERPQTVSGLQAAAAAGQAKLMERWGAALDSFDVPCAQVLLTHGDLVSRRRYLNARAALRELLDRGALPIVNENDTVSVEEIKLGDNDVLAAEVAGLIGGDLLVLLTTADGLMTGDPRAYDQAERVSFLAEVSDTAREYVGAPSALGTGGMSTKLDAARISSSHGTSTVIAPAAQRGVLAAIRAGDDVGTLIPGGAPKGRARKRWIATTLRPAGRVTVDAGARKALEKKASLLFAGVREVEGDFDAGDCIEVVCEGEVFARGLAALDADHARQVAGKRTAEAAALLGDRLPDELIHRDDLAILTTQGSPA
jgi:glutamate 5-kinase